MSGMLLIVTFSLVNSTAEITCNASFFAPCGMISPFNGFPPIISNAFIYLIKCYIVSFFEVQ